MEQVVSGNSTKVMNGASWKAGLAVVLGLMLSLSGNESAQAKTGGSPYDVEYVKDADPAAGVVETWIVAQEATVDIGDGAATKVMAFKSCSDAGLTTCTPAVIPGPEFQLKVGDQVTVHYVNALPSNKPNSVETNVSGIHWHGIELNNVSDGTEVTQAAVAPGVVGVAGPAPAVANPQNPSQGVYDYKFTVTRPGIFWYHPHHHAGTNQVAKGLYGSIIVKDPNEDTLIANNVIPANDATHTKTLVISDITVCGATNPATYNSDPNQPTLPHVSGITSWAINYENHRLTQSPKILCETEPMDANGDPAGAYAAHEVPNIQSPGPIGRMSEGFTVLTNGVNVGGRAGTPAAPGALAVGASTLDVQAGQGLRLQIVNPSTVRYLRLRLTTASGAKIPLVRIGGEGGLLDYAVVEGGVTATGFNTKYNRGEILIPPASRADVVAKIPSLVPQNSVLTLWTEDFQRVAATYSWTPTVPVMHLLVSGKASTAYGIANGKKLLASLGAAKMVRALGAPTASLVDPANEGGDGGSISKDVKLTFDVITGGFQPSIDTIPMPRDFTGIGADGMQSGGLPFPGGNPFFLASARHATLSKTVELTVTNMTGAHHPFHLHGFSIQPIKLVPGPVIHNTGPSYVFRREFRDIVDVPAFYSLKFRVSLDDRKLTDFTADGGGVGRWLFHCHILPHATFGMMSELHVH